ncbi:MAG: hypothetical protein EOO65_00050 [Methanosarcinales archaeon]|nr:MAG: hypothetical protein EOO65_00050 [Methanosarcinales archaeon]
MRPVQASMHTCEQFFEYQASAAISQGSLTTFNFTEADASPPNTVYSAPLYDCCSYPANMSNPAAGNTSAPCSACPGVCSGKCYTGAFGTSNSTQGVADVTISAMYGFDWVSVVALYGSIAAFTALWLVCQRRLRAKHSAHTTSVPALSSNTAAPMAENPMSYSAYYGVQQ